MALSRCALNGNQGRSRLQDKRNRMRLLKFLSSKQKSLSGQLSDARTQVSASIEPVDAADIPVASDTTGWERADSTEEQALHIAPELMESTN